jgi:hypothetical protein
MAEALEEKENPAAAPKARAPFKFWLYAVLSAIATGGIGYGIAYGQGRGEVKAVETELESRVKAHEEARKEWDSQMSELRRRNALLGARNTLAQAQAALEANNFGIAQDQLDKAGTAINKEAAGDEKLAAVGAKLRAFRFNVSADIREQKSALAGFLTSVDEALAGGP